MIVKRIIFLSALLLLKPSFAYDTLIETRLLLGTYVTIEIEKTPRCQEACKQAFDTIEEMENLFNRFNPNSEISLLNYNGKATVSQTTKQLLQKAIHISQVTQGAFDITCKPVIDLYNKCAKRNTSPSQKEIEEILAVVGWQKIRLQKNCVTLKKGTEIDTGGIAKGFIADKAMDVLKKHGVKNALVNTGGDITCAGRNPEGKKWSIGIRNPKNKHKIICVLNITNNAVATSGDYERYLKIKKNKFSHIINPLTGKTVQDFPVSVTIIAPDCATADGLATGCFVLGHQKAIRLLNTLQNVEGLIIDKDMNIYRTSGFRKFEN